MTNKFNPQSMHDELAKLSKDDYRKLVYGAFQVPSELFVENRPSTVYEWELQRRAFYGNQFKMIRYTNKRVYETWGSELDNYMKVNHPKYSYATKVEIVAGDSRGIEWVSSGQFDADINFGFVDIHDLSPIVNFDKEYAPFRQIIFNNGSHMLLAYVEAIDTLFIRTLFEITHSEVDPNDIMDIESRLGI